MNGGGGFLTSSIKGVFNFMGQAFANGKRIDDTHTYKNAQPGMATPGCQLGARP